MDFLEAFLGILDQIIFPKLRLSMLITNQEAYMVLLFLASMLIAIVLLFGLLVERKQVDKAALGGAFVCALFARAPLVGIVLVVACCFLLLPLVYQSVGHLIISEYVAAGLLASVAAEGVGAYGIGTWCSRHFRQFLAALALSGVTASVLNATKVFAYLAAIVSLVATGVSVFFILAPRINSILALGAAILGVFGRVVAADLVSMLSLHGSGPSLALVLVRYTFPTLLSIGVAAGLVARKTKAY